MIKIVDLQKNYKTKSKQTLRVLKGINLELGSKGFVVVLGKSGSGKSTLLNLLGGLDKFDSGDILIKDKSTKDFSVNDWDSYRNTYVGFIFQNFFLIEEFTVGKNIAMALELQGYTKEEIPTLVDDVLTSVDLKEYKDRKPNELSGGQKQRIAIARALVKNPDIILADEPTGNLDSKTGKFVLDTLKEQSKEKLVIMVTHDLAFAKEYGDRIIELKNGEIASDTINNKYNLNFEEQKDNFSLKRSSLAFSSSFKLALSSVFTKKVKLFFMMILFILSLVFFGMATNFARYDVNRAASVTFHENNINEILIQKGQSNCKLTYNTDGYFENVCDEIKSYDLLSDIDTFNNKYSNNKFYEVRLYKTNFDLHRKPPYYSMVSDFYKMIMYHNVDHLDSKLIYGNKINESNGVYITDYIANFLIEIGEYGEIQIDELIGEKLIVNDYEFNISGILDTDYEKYDDLKDRYYSDEFGKYYDDVSYTYFKIITTIDNINIMDANALVETNGNHYNTKIDWYEKMSFDGFEDKNTFDTNLLIGTSKEPSNNDEVVLPVSILQELRGDHAPSYEEILQDPQYYVDPYLNTDLNERFTISYVNSDGLIEDEQCKIVGFYNDSNSDRIIIRNNSTSLEDLGTENYVKYFNPEYIRSKGFIKSSGINNQFLLGNSKKPSNDNEIMLPFTLLVNLYVEDNNETLTDEEFMEYQNLILENHLDKNIVLNYGAYNRVDEYDETKECKVVGIYDDREFINAKIGVSDNLFYHAYHKNIRRNILVEIGDNINENTLLLRELTNNQYVHSTAYSSLIYELQKDALLFKNIFLGISGVFAVFTSIMMFTFISASIKAKQKEIGTLRAIGARGIDVAKIFIVEGLIISLSSVLIAFILMVIITDLLNKQIINNFKTDFVFIYNDFFSMLTVLGLGLTVTLLASFIPVKRITNMKPIDAIKNK